MKTHQILGGQKEWQENRIAKISANLVEKWVSYGCNEIQPYIFYVTLLKIGETKNQVPLIIDQLVQQWL